MLKEFTATDFTKAFENMPTDFTKAFENMPVDFTKIFESMQKIADLNVAKIEAAVEAQKAITQSLVELTEARVKAASSVKDVESFNVFVKDQAELAQSSVEKLIEDSKGAVEDAQAYGEEVKKILSEATEVAAPVAAPVAKKAAAKPAAKKAA